MKLEFEKHTDDPSVASIRAIQITKQEAWAVGMSIRAALEKTIPKEDLRVGLSLEWLRRMSNEGWQEIAREAMKAVFPMLIVEEIEIDVVRAKDDEARALLREAMENLHIGIWETPDKVINPDFTERKILEWKGTRILVERDGYGALRLVMIAPEMEIEEAVSKDEG